MKNVLSALIITALLLSASRGSGTQDTKGASLSVSKEGYYSLKGDKTGNGFDNGGDGVRPFTKTKNALAGGGRVGGKHHV